MLRSYYNSAIKELVELSLFHSHPLFRILSSLSSVNGCSLRRTYGYTTIETKAYNIALSTRPVATLNMRCPEPLTFLDNRKCRYHKILQFHTKRYPLGTYTRKDTSTVQSSSVICPVQTHFLHATTKARKSRHHSSYVSKTY